MPDLAETIRGMSPAALRIYKQQLPLRLKTMSEMERSTVLSRLQGIPELTDVFGDRPQVGLPEQPQAPTDIPFWQRGLQVFAAPFEWVQETVIDPLAATVTAPFSPQIPGTEELPWIERQVKEYKAWDAPFGVKFALEMLPWMAIPGAGQLGGAIGGIGRIGLRASLKALGGAVAKRQLLSAARIGAGTALQYSPWGLAEKATQAALRPILTRAGRALTPAMERLGGKIPPTPPAPAVVQKLTNLVKDFVLPAREAIKLTQKVGRKRVSAELAVALAKAKGRKGVSRIAGVMKGPLGEYPAVGAKFTSVEIDDLMNMIYKSKELPFNKANATLEFSKWLDTGLIPPPSSIEIMGRIFGDEFANVLTQARGVAHPVMAKALDLANAPRAILASWDMSAVMRQGLISTLRLGVKGKFKEVGKSVKYMFQAWGSEKNMAMADDILKALPNNAEGRAMGMYLAPIREGVITKLEESFMSKFAQKIPLVRRSERAYVTYLNAIRSFSWEATAPVWKASGAGTRDLQGLARLINASTGRGALPKALDKFSPVLSTILFSPRLQLSRFQLPSMLFSKSPYVRKEAAKMLATFMGTGATIVGLLQFTDDSKVELDPRSSDFGKIKVGDTRLDIWTGYVQYAKFLGQVLTAQRKSSFGNLNPAERLEIIERMIQSKLSPAAGFLIDLLKGENYMGEELFVDTRTSIKQLRDRFMPLFLQDMWEAIEQNGQSGIWQALPGVAGVGVITYVNELARKRDEESKEKYGLSWEELGQDPRYGPIAQRRLEKESPALQRAIKEYDKKTEGTSWADWKSAGKVIEGQFKGSMEQAVAKFRTFGDGREFREEIGDVFSARRGAYAARSGEPRFQDLVLRLEQPITPERAKEMGPQQVALRQYDNSLFGDDMWDMYGDYRYEEADRRRDLFIQQFGQEALDYVEEYRGLKYEDLPPEYHQFVEVRKMLRPYWEISARIWSQLPPQMKQIADQITILEKTDTSAAKRLQMQYPQILLARRQIALLRKQLKLRNPRMAEALRLFYS